MTITTNRRTLLASVAAATGLLVLAGCGGAAKGNDAAVRDEWRLARPTRAHA